MNKRVNPHHKRHRGWAVIAALGVCSLLTGLIVWEPVMKRYIVEHPYLTVQEIRVDVGDAREAHRRLSPREVEAWSGLQAGVPVLQIDPWQVEAQLTSHPWIRSAYVELALPQRVHLMVHPRQPVAIIRREELTYLDQNGECFRDTTSQDRLDLPYVSGLDGMPLDAPMARQALTGALQLLALTDLWHQPLSEIHWDERDGFTLFLAQRQAMIHLGWETIPDALVQVRRVLEAWPEDGPAAVFDARFANQIVVRPFSVSATLKGEEDYV